MTKAKWLALTLKELRGLRRKFVPLVTQEMIVADQISTLIVQWENETGNDGGAVVMGGLARFLAAHGARVSGTLTIDLPPPEHRRRIKERLDRRMRGMESGRAE